MPNDQQKKPKQTNDTMTASQRQAEVIKQTSTAAVLAVCLQETFAKVVQSDGFKEYCHDMLLAAGQPKDPIQKMLFLQVLLAHHRIESLHAQSACAESAEEAAIFNASAVRLMAEFRKSSLALRELRSPVTSPNLTVVKQQNLAAGNQQIALVENQDIQQQPEKNDSRTKLESNTKKAISYEAPIDFLSKSAAGSSRSAQPIETRKNQQCRTPTPSGIGNGPQTVDEVNWPENREREETVCG